MTTSSAVGLMESYDSFDFRGRDGFAPSERRFWSDADDESFDAALTRHGYGTVPSLALGEAGRDSLSVTFYATKHDAADIPAYVAVVDTQSEYTIIWLATPPGLLLFLERFGPVVELMQRQDAREDVAGERRRALQRACAEARREA